MFTLKLLLKRSCWTFIFMALALPVSARVCFLPDSTDCGEGDVDVPEVQITCATYGGYEAPEACLADLKDKTAQTCTLNSGCYYPKCAYDSERNCKNDNPDKKCLSQDVDGVKCWYSQPKTCSEQGYKNTPCTNDEDSGTVPNTLEASDGPCYKCTPKKECKYISTLYYGPNDTCPQYTDRKDAGVTGKDGVCSTCEPQACTKINAAYKNAANQNTCGSDKEATPVAGTDSAADGPCYKCVDDTNSGDKTTITIKTKDVIEGCTDDSWEDDNNGTLFTCVQKVTSSFKTQASDGNSYNVSLSLNGRNLVTDSDDNEITENVSSCQIFNYPLNIAENNETKTYTYGSCEIYTDDDNYYYDVEAGVKTLSVSVNGVQVLSGLTSPIVIEGSEFALLGDFDGKTYDAGNYTIKFVKATDYCKDVNASYIGEQKSCLSTQDKIPVDGVTTEIDGQCYTCQTKAEYANTATLCCSLGYQEREYMSGFNWYSYTGDGVKEGCVPYLMWQDAVNQHKNDDDYVSEYGSKPNGYPNQFGCPAYGMDGKWYIGWFGSMQLDFGLNYCPDVDVNPYSGGDKAFEFGNYIEGSLYNISGYVQDGIYKQRLITSLLDTKENHGVVCGDNIQKWLDEHRSNVTMCRYNFTTVTRDDDAYYKIHEIGSSSNEMLNHCWYQDAEGRDVTDNIVASKRAPAARNKIAPIDESKADDDYQVRTYAEKYNGDLVDACKGYSTNKEKLTPLTVDIKN